MTALYIVAISIFCLSSGVAKADKLQIEFDDDAQRAFGAEKPLLVEVIRTEKEIEVRLSNVTSKHLVITKAPHSGSSSYNAADGSKLEEGAWGALSTPPDYYDHVVLRPKPNQNEKGDIKTLSVFKIASDHKNATTYVFSSTLSGYFPTIDKYLTFTVKGSLDLSREPNKANKSEMATPRKPSD